MEYGAGKFVAVGIPLSGVLQGKKKFTIVSYFLPLKLVAVGIPLSLEYYKVRDRQRGRGGMGSTHTHTHTQGRESQKDK